MTTPNLRSIPAAAEDYAAPKAGRETILAAVLADVLGIERVTVDSHFFDDLDADSLVMAHSCARVRKRPDVPPVSMKDIYRHPTIGGPGDGSVVFAHRRRSAAHQQPVVVPARSAGAARVAA